MFLRDSLSARSLVDISGAVAVVAEPLDGYSDEEVAQRLRSCGASRIELLAPGYLTARILPNSLEEVQGVARITLKKRKEPLAGCSDSC